MNALGFRTTTVYDAVGQRAALVDARSNRHSFVYNAVGQETERIDPLNRRTTLGFDAAGQQDLRIDARGNRTTYTYSENSQLTSRKYPDNTRATFTYDETGNRTLMANATGRYSYSYDGNSQKTVAENPSDKTITYAYDPVGNRSHMDAPDSGRFTYVYNAADQITSLHNAFNERTSFAYDAAGRRTVKKLANGTRASYTYDPASNLTNLHNLKSDDTVISSFDYRYNEIGNRMAVGEANGDRVTWTYDNTSQLTSEHRSGANAFRNTVTFDSVGNRLVLNEDGTRTTSVFDVANQTEHSAATAGRTTFTFDADGNQQIVEQPNGVRTTNVWDYENKTSSVEIATGVRNTMTYQPDGLRVELEDSTGTKTFLWDNQTYLAEADASDVTQVVYNNESEAYGNLISQHRRSGTLWVPSYYHNQSLGSTRELTDANETVTDSYLYDACGNVISSTGSTTNPFLWTGNVGYYFDTDTEDYYIRARIYAPSIARWLNSYSTNLIEGANIYRFASNDPITIIAPSGLMTASSFLISTINLKLKLVQSKGCHLARVLFDFEFAPPYLGYRLPLILESQFIERSCNVGCCNAAGCVRNSLTVWETLTLKCVTWTLHERFRMGRNHGNYVVVDNFQQGRPPAPDVHTFEFRHEGACDLKWCGAHFVSGKIRVFKFNGEKIPRVRNTQVADGM